MTTALEAGPSPCSEPQQLPFSLQEFERRLQIVREAADARGLDTLVVHSAEDIYYLTGYQSLGFALTYHALVVPLASTPCFVIRYGERSNVWARSWLQELHTYGDSDDPFETLCSVLRRSRPRRIGVEPSSRFLTPSAFARLAQAMDGMPLVECADIVEEVRAVKSAEEVAYLEAAARVSAAGAHAGIEAIADGRSDRDIAIAVYAGMIGAGGEYPSLPPLVAVGPRTAMFHTTWSGQSIHRGDLVSIEVPGVVGRYLAPVARSAALGEPPARIVERYEIARDSLETGIAAMRPGATCSEVFHAFARAYVRAGYEVPIKVGYSVGISFPPRWSEFPGLNLLPDNQTELRPGMVLHTPRGVRVLGDQTPIVSETTLVTASGPRVLTDVSRLLARRL